MDGSLFYSLGKKYAFRIRKNIDSSLVLTLFFILHHISPQSCQSHYAKAAAVEGQNNSRL